MRTLIILAAVASLSSAAPALAQSVNGDYSANNGSTAYNHSAMSNHAAMHRSHERHDHALGSVRHPTVGNTANQRVNGG